MFESESDVELSGGKTAPSKAPFNWKSLPVDLLIKYRDEITRVLPPLTLKETNLEEELLLQYHSLRALQNDVLNDEEIALNQRAQVANTVSNALLSLGKLQSEVYTQERFKAIESLMIRHLSRLPEDTAEAFLKDYEVVLSNLK